MGILCLLERALRAPALDLPDEANALEEVDPLLGEEGVLALLVEAELLALLGDPLPQAAVEDVVLGHDCRNVGLVSGFPAPSVWIIKLVGTYWCGHAPS